jgi:hypothetical protein
VSKSVSFSGDKISQKHRELRDILVSSQIDRKVLSDRLSDYLSALSDQGISSIRSALSYQIYKVVTPVSNIARDAAVLRSDVEKVPFGKIC